MRQHHFRQNHLGVAIQHFRVEDAPAQTDEQRHKANGEVHYAPDDTGTHRNVGIAGRHDPLEDVLLGNGTQTDGHPGSEVFNPVVPAGMGQKAKEIFGYLGLDVLPPTHALVHD